MPSLKTPIPCQSCGKEFVRNAGGQKFCAPCADANGRSANAAAVRKYKKSHPEAQEKTNARNRERRATDPEWAERQRSAYKATYYGNEEYNKAQRARAHKRAAERYWSDPEYRQYVKDYNKGRYQTDPAYRFKMDEYSLARKRGLPPPDADTLEYIKIVRGDPCSYCASDGGAVDHIDPVENGGAHHWENMTGACGSCNSSKNNRTDLFVWLMNRTALLEQDRACVYKSTT